MARIRTIKPDFWTDEKIVELSPLARLLFIGLWNFADDDGRMPYSTTRIKLQILPADSADISALLGEIRGKLLIDVYVVDDKEYLHICQFSKHQKIDKRTPSKHPNPPISTEPPRIPPSLPDGREGNGREEEGNKTSIPTPKKINEVGFEIFWAAYPKRKSKGDAEKAFFKINPDERLLSVILAAIDQAKTQEDWQKERGKYIPYPASWLNAKGWQDEKTFVSVVKKVAI